jgi:hypothetical protein
MPMLGWHGGRHLSYPYAISLQAQNTLYLRRKYFSESETNLPNAKY